MTDKELIQALRHCASGDEYGCLRCPGEATCDECSGKSVMDAADRLEALLAENERLREVTKMMPKWVSVEERLPDKSWNYLAVACDEGAPSDERIWGCRVVVVADYSLRYNAWTWDENGTEYDLTGLVTHWQPLPELPSTEGVE